jgi:ribonuclease D
VTALVPGTAPARWVDDDESLREVVAAAAVAPRYALDTEFHRERSYYPKLALVQVAWEDQLALVDPLGVDVRELVPLFAGPGVAVLHAAQQDLDVLTHACGAVPARLADTQLMAGVLGHSTPSLSSLVSGELQIRLPKADRLTDWLRRPLTGDQTTYAASDVAHLFGLYDRIAAQLDALGRLDWALAECEELRLRPVGPADPETAWLRLKDVRALKARSRGVAQAVAAWRERRAASVDLPVRQVLPDLAILGISPRQPTTVDELAQARGVDERHRRGRIGREIVAAVAEGKVAEPPALPDAVDELDRSKRPAITLVSAWVSQVARDARIDTALLATRADLVAILRGDPDARLAHGWRAELVGDGLTRLMDGHAGLTFDGKGSLKLIDV